MLRSLTMIGPGIMKVPINPLCAGWGAVESRMTDLAEYFQQEGIHVTIVNTPIKEEIIRLTNEAASEVVMLEYDDHIDIVPRLHSKNIFVTSHFGYLDHPSFFDHLAYYSIFNAFVQGANESRFTICALSPSIKQRYVEAGCQETRVRVVANGADTKKFLFYKEPHYPQRSIYLAKIESRKRQAIYQKIDTLYFAGNCVTHEFDTCSPRYLGEWTKNVLYTELSKYANLVLLSNGEAHPLVCCEALVCGLGLVLSEVATANLDTSLPFITVIPNDKLNDVDYVTHKIAENRSISLANRLEIRQYGITHFSWQTRIPQLIQLLFPTKS